VGPARRDPCTPDTPRCDFWNWGAGALRPPCCTEHFIELTSFVHELLEENGIVHWLDYGTLLGAVREQAFIAWDEDVDFGVLEEDVPAILALEPEITAAGHALDTHNPIAIRVNLSAVNHTHVDLFVWREVDGVLRTDFNPDTDWPGIHGHTSFARSYVQDLESVSLNGMRLPAPSPVHRFLAGHRYGPDYMVPTRPILSTWLYPSIGPDQMTPKVKDMLAEIAEKDRRLAELNTRSRFSRTRLGSRWQQAGLPPAQTEGGGDTVEQLARSTAWLDLAIKEIEKPGLGTRMRRARRRLAAAAGLLRRP
jgi:LicD family protein